MTTCTKWSYVGHRTTGYKAVTIETKCIDDQIGSQDESRVLNSQMYWATFCPCAKPRARKPDAKSRMDVLSSLQAQIVHVTSGQSCTNQ